jgi:hypothetical protein
MVLNKVAGSVPAVRPAMRAVSSLPPQPDVGLMRTANEVPEPSLSEVGGHSFSCW